MYLILPSPLRMPLPGWVGMTGLESGTAGVRALLGQVLR